MEIEVSGRTARKEASVREDGWKSMQYINNVSDISWDVQRQVSTIQAFHSTTRNTSMK